MPNVMVPFYIRAPPTVAAVSARTEDEPRRTAVLMMGTGDDEQQPEPGTQTNP